jgi:alkylated DNA repair dioxygenase AlkB
MSLFPNDTQQNLLPFDGELSYFGPVFSAADAKHWQQILTQSVAWKNDELFMFGKKIVTSRKVALYADNTTTYTYSKQTKQALAWTTELLQLKQIIKAKTAQTFNMCLLNLYHHGKESMGWHSDNESELQTNGSIASLSLGAERKFMFKHKESKKVISLNLENGSLLLMQGSIQQHWLHQLPPMPKVEAPRLNLTFRNRVM